MFKREDRSVRSVHSKKNAAAAEGALMTSVRAHMQQAGSKRIYEKSFCGNLCLLCCTFKVEK